MEPSLYSDASLLTQGAQFANDLGIQDYDGVNDFTPPMGAVAGFGDGINTDIWGNWDITNEAQNLGLPQENTRVLLSATEQPATVPAMLALATHDAIVPEEAELITAEIRDLQSQRIGPGLGGRQIMHSGPRSGVQKTKHKFDATIAEIRAGRLPASAGCWIQHKKVLTYLPQNYDPTDCT